MKAPPKSSGSSSQNRSSPASKFLFLLFLLFCAFLYGRIVIDGDGISYYAMTLSLVRDGDFHLENERKVFRQVMAPLHPLTGKPAPLFSCGFAILYSPFLYVADQFPDTIKIYPQNDRFPFFHALAIFIGSGVFGIASYLLALRMQVRPFLAFACFLGTPLFYYSFVMPSYAHAADAFLMSLAFVLVFAKFRFAGVLLGIVLSLSVMLRNNNIAVAGTILLWFLLNRKWKSLFHCGMGAVPGAIIWMFFNKAEYGSWITTGYRIQFQEGFLSEMLFHPWGGLFVWSPVAVLGCMGLLAGTWERRSEHFLGLMIVLSVMLTVQFQPNWWGGCSFGQRFFIHLYIFWALGLSTLYEQYRRPTVLAAGICAVWMFVLLNVYLVNFGTSTGRKMLQENQCRHSPIEMIAGAWNEYDRSREKNPLVFWWKTLESKPFPTLATLGGR